MKTDKNSPPLRHAARAGVVTLGLVLGTFAAPALASEPSTWENTDNPPLIQTLSYLLGVPLLVFVVIYVLVYLPSMIRRDSAEPAVAFQERSEWFGGPRKGVDAAPETTSDSGDQGGAGSSW